MKNQLFEKLPLLSERHRFEVTEDVITRFNTLFRREPKGSTTPLTLGAIALKGVFQILDQLEVNWKGLLHVSQSFEFENHLEGPCVLETSSSLIKHRLRAGRHWLFFETDIYHLNSQKKHGRALAQIMVGDDGHVV